MATPTFIHLDLDAFFVSVERLRDPSLIGRAVIVGGSDPRARGAVACASYEARAEGVRAGMALRRAGALCPRAVFLDGHPEAYLDCSQRVRALLVARVPRVVPRSLDEFDLDLTGCERVLGDPLEVGRRLRAEVLSTVGLPCTVAVAGTPLVAKVAAGEAKPAGLIRVPAGEEAAWLAPLPIGKLPGVGPRTESRLQALGVTTVGELAALPETLVRGALGGQGLALRERARGGTPRLEAQARGFASWGPLAAPPGLTWRSAAAAHQGRREVPLERQPFATGQALAHAERAQRPAPSEAAEEASPLARSISRQRTFGEDQDDAAVLDAALVRLVEDATAALRVERLRARSVEVSVRWTDLKDELRRARLPREGEEEAVLAGARALLARLLRRRMRVRRLGVGFHGLVCAHEQRLLFQGPAARSRRALGLALDTVRTRFGWEAVRFASGLPGVEASDDP